MLLLHLLSTLLVGSLLVRALAFLRLLLFDALTLLVLLSAHILQLLLMLLLELRIAIGRRIVRWSSRRRPIVILRPIRLRIRWWSVRPIVGRRPVSLRIVWPVRIWRWRIGPISVGRAIRLIWLHIIRP